MEAPELNGLTVAQIETLLRDHLLEIVELAERIERAQIAAGERPVRARNVRAVCRAVGQLYGIEIQ